MMKNGGLAGLPSVTVPYSKMKAAICECLKSAGFISDFSKKVRKGHPVLEIALAYQGKQPKIRDAERVSKQSRRVYMKMRDIHTVRGGTGLLVLSTPKGILSGKDARKEQVGGEILFRLW